MSKSWDEQLYQSIALKRSAFFRPIAMVLDKLGVSPDMVTALGVVAMAGFIWGISRSLVTGFWFFLAVIICDQIDGAIARYRHHATERGKFIDVTADTTTFALFMIGLTYAGYVGAATATSLVYFATISRILGVVVKNIGRRSEWLFFAGAGPIASTFVYAMYAFFLLAVFAHFTHLQVVAQIMAAGAILSCLSELATILRRA